MAILPAYAAAPETYQEIEIIHTEYGDIEMTTTLVIYDSPLRSSTKSAKKTQTFKSGSTVIGDVTLSATFGYDGSTAWVVSASGSNTIGSGWSYKNESISKSGNTAKLTAQLTKLLLPNVNVTISMTCSPSGQIS